MKKIFTLATILLTGQVHAQGMMETNLGDSKILDYITSHFSASYHGEMYGVRRDTTSEDAKDREIKDFKILHNPSLIYKPSENWQVLTTAEFKFSDQEAGVAGASYPNAFYRALATLTRKNILTESENGIKMDLGVGRRQFNTGSDQSLEGEYALASYGNNRVFSTLSKKLGDVDSSLFLQYLHNDYKKTSDSTWKHGVELIPSISLQLTSNLSYFFNDDINLNTAKTENTDRPFSITHEMNIGVLTYQWTDKISTYYQLKYLHLESFSAEFQSQDDYLENYAGLTYAFTPKQSVTFEVGNELAHARDGRDGFSKKIAYPELALYVDVAM